MNEQTAMKWARETVTGLASRADAGDPAARHQLELVALSYLTGWLHRDNAIKAAQIRMLAAAGEEC